LKVEERGCIAVFLEHEVKYSVAIILIAVLGVFKLLIRSSMVELLKNKRT